MTIVDIVTVADQVRGKLLGPISPGGESVAEDGERLMHAPHRVTAMPVGRVRVVIDGVDESTRTPPGVPPRAEQPDRPPKRDLRSTGYPPAV
ncbi:hypothetical protein [Pseudonocardia kunmingensis]|uniref:hypothetical protein n=1 Tax=Pseudonocardia kunmingensis TaxID=630975 RepID=UPI001153620E|nr:hypothetical protein [Pseudonocardia kunmingensis]